jgi:integrase
MTLEQAVALLGVVGVRSEYRLSTYVVLSLLTEVRTEEARALHWAEVDLEAGTVAVYRSVRAVAGAPRVRDHHQGGRAGGGLDSTRAAALVRVHPERQ